MSLVYLRARWQHWAVCVALSGAFLLTGCAPATATATTAAATAQAGTAEPASLQLTEAAAPTATAEASGEPAAAPTVATLNDVAVDTTITFTGDAATVSGEGAEADGALVTIEAAGTYALSGAASDGQVIVDTKDDAPVVLVLSGLDLTCANSAPLYVRKADEVVVLLAADSDNRLTDGAEYVLDDVEDGEPNAALFSKADLTIAGEGALTVVASYNDGIASKDGLDIAGGVLQVTAVGDGLRGRDYLRVSGAQITVDAGKDGLKSTNDEDAALGYVLIEDGVLDITAAEDGIQAETDLTVAGGNLQLTTGGGSANASTQRGQPGNTWGAWPAGPQAADTAATSDDASAKGLKAGVDLAIRGGTIYIDSSDDAVHANGAIALSGGELTLFSGDDGVHADVSLTITGGRLDLGQSYEGLESAEIVISGGELRLVASDDGINVSGGADGSSLGGRPGQNRFAASANQRLEIDGGYIWVDAAGDGLDANGSILMTAGTVLVNGPTDNGNGALDYAGGFQITGGVLVAVGSVGMAQAPDTSSTQCAVMITLPQVQAAGTPLQLTAEDGSAVLTYVPGKEYQSVVFSSPELQQGQTYTVWTGGTVSGEGVDGLYADGVLTGATAQSSFTIEGIITGGGMMGGPGGGLPGIPSGGGPRGGGGR
ncbi:MAG: carbohydrate-binding domain-containing protein [Anaerolineales bacterium]